LIEIIIDRNNLTGSMNFVGEQSASDGTTRRFSPDEGAKLLASREPSMPLAADPNLPDDTRWWALLQQLGGGTWGGCVYDVEALATALRG
jgi:hypothetical protein